MNVFHSNIIKLSVFYLDDRLEFRVLSLFQRQEHS